MQELGRRYDYQTLELGGEKPPIRGLGFSPLVRARRAIVARGKVRRFLALDF